MTGMTTAGVPVVRRPGGKRKTPSKRVEQQRRLNEKRRGAAWQKGSDRRG